MANLSLEIPKEFQDQLTVCDPVDKRSDGEILETLTQHQPVASEKNVWAFWHSGVSPMPAWCQRNVINWVRTCGLSWTVRVLDSVPGSPNFFLEYVSASALNDALVNGTMDGTYFGPHSCDLLRGACLYNYGGVFMDVGIFLIRDLDRICWKQLEDPESPFQVATPWMYGITMANHFVASRRYDPFIKRWHDLFVHLWKNRKNSEGIIDDPLVSFAKEISFEDSHVNDFHWDFKVPARTVFEYITQVVCWMRVCMLEHTEDGFSGSDYWQKHVLIWEVLPENWGGEATVGWEGSGQKMYDLLSLRRDADPNTQKYKDAYNLVWRLLTKSSMQKITHGKNLTNSTHLGELWDGNTGKDCEPGTFAELLRYGTVHFRQTRDEIVYAKAPAPPKTLKKGLLEP